MNILLILAHHLSMFYSNDGIIKFIQVIYLFIYISKVV